MLVALAILLLFGVMAVTALAYGTQLWRSGHRRSYAYDVASVVFQQLRDDLDSARSQFWGDAEQAYDERIKFLLDEVKTGSDRRVQRLRFVRAIPDATTNPRLRQAGDGQDSPDDLDGDADEEYYNLKDDDGDGQVDEDLKALEGLCEVAYVMGLDADDARTLYRGVLGPIGGQAGYSLFEEASFDEASKIYDPTGSVADPLPAEGIAVPVAQNVLHFEVRLWSQWTTAWDEAAPFTSWGNSWQPEYCGPAFWWDSDGVDESQVLDNMYPRGAMAVLVVEAPEELRSPRRMALAEAIDDDDLSIRIRGQLPAHNRAWPYVLIKDDQAGDEWFRYSDFDEATQSFILGSAEERGLRGTDPVNHAAGREMVFGYTLSTAFHNPSGREFWGQQ